MTNLLAQNLVRWRWLFALLSLVIVFTMASGARFLSFATDYQIWFSDDNPQYLDFSEIQKTYVKADNVVILITPKDGQVFNQKTLSSVEWLTNEAWQIPFSSRVDSLSNFQYTYALDDDLVVGDLIENAAAKSDKQLAEIKQIALNEPLLLNSAISADAKVTAVNVTINLPEGDSEGSPKVIAYTRNLISQLEQSNPDIEVRLTGLVAMDNAFMEASMADMGSLTLIMFALILIGLLFFLRSITATLTILMIILLSIVSTMGFAGWLGVQLTPVSASAPTIVMTIVVANAVHILLSMIHNMRAGMEKRSALSESLRVNMQPVVLATITTMVGFLTMNFSDVPPFHHLANMVAVGVLISFMLSMTLLPWLLMLFPVRVKVSKNKTSNGIKVIGEFVINRRKQVLWSMTGLTVLLCSLIPLNIVNDKIWEFFDQSVAFRVDTDYASDHLTGPYNIEYGLDSNQPGGASDPEYLQVLEQYRSWLYQQPEVVHVNVLSDIMKRLNKNLHGDDPDLYRLPADRELAAQYLLLYEMSLPYGLDLNNQINVDKSGTRVTVSLHNLSNNEMIAFNARAEAWLHNAAPWINVTSGSPQFMFSHISLRTVKQMTGGVAFALALISLLILISLRSLKIGIISLVPNLVPPLMSFGLWALLVGEIGFALALSVSMIIGIIVDDTVHFLSKYMRGRREKQLNAEQAVRYAFTNVGPALFITTAVLTAGFSVLMLSTFKLNFELGLITAMTISIALVVDLLLLPALLLTFDKKEIVLSSKQALDNKEVSLAGA
ncbi:efflux RND transporter permease subunit [Psychromonas ossibalaenae]|uniref:efflux RND transporter permease subunit n=1 Tax=Psychromonas ossibalaenae TaxID=444922 RepID=UPI000373BE63|nr:efflux RND transporter permease subunit [Psychromonas ossibalaenae]